MTMSIREQIEQKFQQEKLLEQNTVHLQAVGKVPAVVAAKLTVGNHLMYNFGSTAEIVAIKDASKCFLEITTRHTDGKEYTSRRKKDALVPLSPETKHREANPQVAGIIAILRDAGITILA